MADTNEGALPVVAYQYQHDETGRTGFVDQWQLDNGWRHMNPRLLVGPALTDHATATALIEDLRRQLAAVQADADRYRWVHQFLSIDDAGDDSAAYGLFVDKEGMEGAAWRVKMWRSFDHLGEDPTPDDAIDAARSAVGAGEKG